MKTWFMAKRKSAMAVARTSGATTSTITVKRIANLRKISVEQRVEAIIGLKCLSIKVKQYSKSDQVSAKR